MPIMMNPHSESGGISSTNWNPPRTGHANRNTAAIKKLKNLVIMSISLFAVVSANPLIALVPEGGLEPPRGVNLARF